MIQVTSF